MKQFAKNTDTDNIDNLEEEVTWEYISDNYGNNTIALAQHLDLTPEEAEMEIKDNGDDSYSYGNEEYLVLTDKEATSRAIEDIANLIEEIGVAGLNITLSHFIDTDWFDDALQESTQSYAEGIKDENDSEYGNRLIQEMVDANIISEEDIKDEDFDEDDYLEHFVDYLKNEQHNDSVKWYIDNFGEDEFDGVIIRERLIDMQKLAKYIIRIDGRASTLASYDHEEHEEQVDGEYYYIYRTN